MSMTVFFHTLCVLSIWMQDVWAEKNSVQTSQSYIFPAHSLAYGLFYQKVRGKKAHPVVFKIQETRTCSEGESFRQKLGRDLKATGKGLETNEFPQAFRTLPLGMYVAGTITHILTHDHCISPSSCWCCHLNTDISQRTTPYGGIAALSTVKYRSDVNCTYKTIFLVFRMTVQARFFLTSQLSLGYQNKGQILKFSTCSCLYRDPNSQIFWKFSVKRTMIMVLCYINKC